MRLNLTFADVPLEAGMVCDFAELIMKSEAELAGLARDHVWAGLDRSDDADRQLGYYLEDHIERGIYLRFFTGASVVASWAVYEAIVIRVADYIRTQRCLTLKLADLRGDFLHRSRKYFKDVLETTLHHEDVDWERLGAIARLRHAFAHANGQLLHVAPNRRASLEQLVGTIEGLAVVEGYVVISSGYARDTATFINGLINELIDRVAPILAKGDGA